MFKKHRPFNETIRPGLLKDLAAYLAEYEEAFPEEILSASTAASFIEESAVSYNTAPKPSEDMPMYAPHTPKPEAHRPDGISADLAGGFFADTVFPTGASLDDVLGGLDDTFQELLLKTIDKKGLKDSDVYKKAGIDRRHFSKIRGNREYHPKKPTALALCLAMRLNLDETTDLIERAGYALSPGSRADLIVRYCIENEIFDLFEVNGLLFHYDQPLLGA